MLVYPEDTKKMLIKTLLMLKSTEIYNPNVKTVHTDMTDADAWMAFHLYICSTLV